MDASVELSLSKLKFGAVVVASMLFIVFSCSTWALRDTLLG
jgi:hypothetical protein